MKKRKLGNTGLEISELAYGAASLGDIYRTTDESEGIASVHAAMDGGINYFDVAPLYGFTLAETRLGKALAGRRDQVYLATKVCRDRFDQFDFSAARVKASIDESLTRLQTDHVDVFQIHDIEFATETQILEETLPAMREVQASGKARFIGITGLPVRYLRKIAAQTEIDLMMSWGHLNLLEDELDSVLTPLAAERGFGLVSASPLLQGILSDNSPPEWHRSPPEVHAICPRMAEVCRKADTNLAAVALKYAVDYPHVASNVVGMSTARRVERNLTAIQTPIPEGLLETLLEMAKPVKNRMWFEGNPDNNIPPSDPDAWVPQSPEHTHE